MRILTRLEQCGLLNVVISRAELLQDQTQWPHCDNQLQWIRLRFGYLPFTRRAGAKQRAGKQDYSDSPHFARALSTTTAQTKSPPCGGLPYSASCDRPGQLSWPTGPDRRAGRAARLDLRSAR